MGINKDNTHWFFILPSTKGAEHRHIYDVALGIACLLAKSVPYSNISTFIDNASEPTLEAIFSKFNIKKPSTVYSTNNIEPVVKNVSTKNAVVFVTGHGSPNGLDSLNLIKPFPLFNIFQTSTSFEHVVFYFGQCYAGIFNYMPLSEHLGIKSKCSMVAVGSTGLDSSISQPVDISGIRWAANTFLYSVFLWLINPVDIDGDGKNTIMDSFKFATIRTNEQLAKLKKEDNIEGILEQGQLIKLIEKQKREPMTDDEKKNFNLQILALTKRLAIRYVTQEPWILNAKVAMNTDVS